MIRKTAVVTGASGGIGSAIALQLAKMGFNLALTYNSNSTEKLENQVKQAGAEAISFKMDLESPENIQDVFANIHNKFGRIDVVVCNAGISEEEYLFIDKSNEDISRIIDVNLKGTIYCNREACKYMLKQKSGSIVNISSILGKVGCACEVVYSASKAGIIGLTKALSKEMGQFGVRVNAVAPGFIETKMTSCFSKEEKDELVKNASLLKLGKPEDVAEAVCFLASENSSYITGECIEVSGGLII